MTPSKGLLIAELLLLFAAVPLAFRLLPLRLSPMPALWLAALYCWHVLSRSPGFDARRLWNPQPLACSLPGIFALFVLCAIAITAAVWILYPQQLFAFVRTRPAFWAAIMVLYPVLSVYPQGIIYRAFFFERYQPLFGAAPITIAASAAAFAFSHIVFRSPWSVGLTFLAGLLFAWRYQATGSLLVSSFEHALYGCYMFTVGLGGLFYHGAGRSALKG